MAAIGDASVGVLLAERMAFEDWLVCGQWCGDVHARKALWHSDAASAASWQDDEEKTMVCKYFTAPRRLSMK